MSDDIYNATTQFHMRRALLWQEMLEALPLDLGDGTSIRRVRPAKNIVTSCPLAPPDERGRQVHGVEAQMTTHPRYHVDGEWNTLWEEIATEAPR